MKSYTMPAIIGASVIAVATLFYALFLPVQNVEDATNLDSTVPVISAPDDNEQTSVVANDSNLASASSSEEIEQAFKLVIDIARVQADGMAVFAGRGAPNGSVFISENGSVFAQSNIDENGQWVILPEMPLAPGSHLLQLEMITLEGGRELADFSLVVEISENADEKPLVALVPQSDDQSPTILQMPEEDTVTSQKDEDAVPQTQAEEVAEILGQEDIFIQIGSLSWNADNKLSVHGVASGGDMISGMIGTAKLDAVELTQSGRWSSSVNDNPFEESDTQILEVNLLNADNQVLKTAQLQIVKSQLDAGLDGSLMVVVHKGDALWRIAYRSYGQGVRYVDIVRRNSDKIDNPDLIYPNQIFAVPGVKQQTIKGSATRLTDLLEQ